MRLVNVRDYNDRKYINPDTGRPVMVKVGTRKGKGTTHFFYLTEGQGRVYISKDNFYLKWEMES